MLRSPEVGLFTCALVADSLVAPGAPAGILHTLGRRVALRVPPGISGRVMNPRPTQVLFPVGYGTELYRLAPLGVGEAHAPHAVGATRADEGLVFRAPYSGRFWHRPTPGDPPFVRAGESLREGQTVGLLEVMKTFTHLDYRAQEGLPTVARIVRFLVPDGGEVEDGGGLIELEPVP